MVLEINREHPLLPFGEGYNGDNLIKVETVIFHILCLLEHKIVFKKELESKCEHPVFIRT